MKRLITIATMAVTASTLIAQSRLRPGQYEVITTKISGKRLGECK